MDGLKISRGLSGAWRLMAGKADGLRMLDLSADGFWDSFFAIVIALPALIASWVAIALEADGGGPLAEKIGLMARLALVDIGAWVLPLALLAMVARPAGLASRFVAYVVASNWGSALLVWLMLPASLVRLFAPGVGEFASLLSLGLFAISLVLMWRLTNGAIAKGAALATAVFAGMFFASLLALLGLQSALGISAGL